jgi:hypothetical protein
MERKVPNRERTLAEIRECKAMGLHNLQRSWEYHLAWLDKRAKS